MIKKVKELFSNEKITDTIEFIGKILFLLYAILGFNSIIYGHKIISFVMWPSFLLCAVVIGLRVLRYKQYHKMPALISSIAFCISHIVSSLLHFKYGLKDNIVLFIYLSIYFFVFYVQPLKKEPDKVKKEFNILTICFVLYCFIGSIISIIQMFKGYSDVKYFGFDNYEVISGFMSGRLWGIFPDPNRAALMMMTAIILDIYLIAVSKKYIIKTVLAVLMIPMYAYIIFSDSRTTVVAIFFATLAGVVAYLFTTRQKNVWHFVLKTVLCVVLAFVIAASPVALKDAYNDYAENIKSHQSDDETQLGTTIDLPEIERKYDLSGDVSNRRFDIWKSGFEMISQKPVFGYSYNGIRPYAMEHMPETYIVNNDQTFFSNFHNEIINVLGAQGIVGFIIFVSIIVIILITIFKNAKYLKGKDKVIFAVMIAVIFGQTVGAMFVSLMFYMCTASTIMFWLCLGYMVYILKKSKEDRELETVTNE